MKHKNNYLFSIQLDLSTLNAILLSVIFKVSWDVQNCAKERSPTKW